VAPEVEPVPPEVPSTPPPPPGDVEPQPTVQLPEEKVDESYSKIRFAPTAKFLVAGYNGGGRFEGIVFGSSLRAGLRVSLTPRRPETYAMSVGASLELGLEGLGVHYSGPQIFGMGITLKFGPAAVTRGGLYFPYLDFYLLYVAVPSQFGFAQKFGAGLNFNLLALLTREMVSDEGKVLGSAWGGNGGGAAAVVAAMVVGLLMPDIELVWTPANDWMPYSTLEVRFGGGF
jgi:hypothetical protein